MPGGTVVVLDPGVLRGGVAALEAALADVAGVPALVRFEGAWPEPLEPSAANLLLSVPALTLAGGAVPPAAAAAVDLVLDDPPRVTGAVDRFRAAPHATVAVALLVRFPPPDAWAGLVAESTTYSMLQAGPEFAVWRAGHVPAAPVAGDDGPRVRVQRHGRVTEIVLTRPGRRNAIDVRMREELHAALTAELAGDGPVVVRGDGPAFSHGGDLDEFGTFPDPVSAHTLRLGRSLAWRCAQLAERLVVGIHGAAVGSGIELAAFARHVVAAEHTRIGLPELGLGLIPGAGGTVSVPARVGRRRLLELLLRDGTIPASTAREWGLVDEVVPYPRLESRLLEIAGVDRDVNIAMLLEMAADGLGDRIAIGSRADGLSYEALRRAASGVADRLDGTGVTSLVLTLPNGPVLPVALFGAAWAGVSYAPVNFRLPEAARADMIERLQPAAVFDDERAWLGAAAAGTPSAFPDEPATPAVLLYTSGTSATPKAAVLEHDQLLAYIFNTVEFAAAGDDEAVLLAVPPFHIAGVAAVLSSTYAGRRIVPLPRFTAEDWLVAARDEAVTHAFVVPTMLARITAAMEANPELRVPSLRHLAYGGARTPVPVLERALHLFPETGFVNAYGLTETSSTVSVLGPDDHRLAHETDDPAVRARLSSVGRPVPGIEVVVVTRDGDTCAPGEPGEVHIRGAQVSGTYVGQTSHRDGDGWLHTGDRGWVDAEGYLFVEGRGDDTIIRGGENLSPAEIEDALLRHPSVATVAVVGLPDEEWGEKVAAMVTPAPGATLDVEELRAWAREQLGSIKTPEVVALTDELPQTATGKILRRRIREDLTER